VTATLVPDDEENNAVLTRPQSAGAALRDPETNGHADPSTRRLDLARAQNRDSVRLRARLIGLDTIGIAAVWATAVAWSAARHPTAWGTSARDAAFVAIMTFCTLIALAAERLYRARVCAVRTVELTRLVRVAIISGAIAVVVAKALGLYISTRWVVATPIAMFIVLAVLREAYTLWLRACRTKGRFSRDVIVVGTNDEANELCRLFQIQPELGYRVRGVVGDRQEWEVWESDIPWIADTTAAVSAARELRAGALVAITAVSLSELNQTLRGLLAAGVHVQTSTGIMNIGHRRLRALPMSHQALYYIEASMHPRWQEVAKRTIDLVVASFALALSAPVLLVAAIAIKIEDGGRVLFRQERVGLRAGSFEVLKLRTMSVDAASQMDAIWTRNERRDGPLFKITADPRVTRVGRFLRATSIDEILQLVNVIRGEMSLVGPRPALPHEVAAFDQDHLARLDMRPGITGLWQVEARDNPSFHIYRRLDLFYVENWSLRMDALILLGTIRSLLGRAVRLLRSARSADLPRDRLISGSSPVTSTNSSL
jgi:exopolysaccharide biosynthesis polyprenyl glycosylphosphotransferase